MSISLLIVGIVFDKLYIVSKIYSRYVNGIIVHILSFVR